jgi:hypothetical protein
LDGLEVIQAMVRHERGEWSDVPTGMVHDVHTMLSAEMRELGLAISKIVHLYGRGKKRTILGSEVIVHELNIELLPRCLEYPPKVHAVEAMDSGDDSFYHVRQKGQDNKILSTPLRYIAGLSCAM